MEKNLSGKNGISIRLLTEKLKILLVRENLQLLTGKTLVLD